MVDGNGVGRAGRGPSGRPGTPASLDEAAVRSCDSSHARIGAAHLDLVPTRGVAIRGYLGPHEAPEDETRRYATAGDMLIDPPRRMIDLLHDRSMTGGWRLSIYSLSDLRWSRVCRRGPGHVGPGYAGVQGIKNQRPFSRSKRLQGTGQGRPAYPGPGYIPCTGAPLLFLQMAKR